MAQDISFTCGGLFGWRDDPPFLTYDCASNPTGVESLFSPDHPMSVEAALPRYQVVALPVGLQISLPPRRSWSLSVQMIAWLGGWAIGEVLVGKALWFGTSAPGSPFLVMWLAGWTLIGAWVVITVARQIAGQDILSIGNDVLTYRVAIAGLGLTRKFDLARVRGLRAEPVHELWDWTGAFLPFFGAAEGSIAFEYGVRTYSLGPGLNDAEAAGIVDMLRAKLPSRAGGK
jgi:hypothetical protein